MSAFKCGLCTFHNDVMFERVQRLKSSWAFNSTRFILLFGAYNHTPPKAQSYYKWGGQIKTDHLIPPTQSYSQTKNNSMQPKMKKCYKSWQRWKLPQLQCHAFTDANRHIRTVHVIKCGGGRGVQVSTTMKQQYTWLTAAMRVWCSFL